MTYSMYFMLCLFCSFTGIAATGIITLAQPSLDAYNVVWNSSSKSQPVMTTAIYESWRTTDYQVVHQK